MLLFRSEEHLEAWRGPRGIARGATLSVEQQWRLARVWYRGRETRGWRRRSAEEAEAVFGDLGLDTAFWKLT